MNPWPYAVLTVLGTVGMVAAMRPWYDELIKVVEWEKAAGRSTTLHQRRRLLFWTAPVIVFGVIGAVGDIGLPIYLTRAILQA